MASFAKARRFGRALANTSSELVGMLSLVCCRSRFSEESSGPGDDELAPLQPTGVPRSPTTPHFGTSWIRLGRFPSWQPCCSSLLELDSVSVVPSMDALSLSDPYVQVRVLPGGSTIGAPPPRIWPVLNNARAPVWRLRRLLEWPLSVEDGAAPDDELEVCIYDKDPHCVSYIFGMDFIGDTRISVSELAKVRVGRLMELPLRLSNRARQARLREIDALQDQQKVLSAGVGQSSAARRRKQEIRAELERLLVPPVVALRLWPHSVHSHWPRKKWIFLVRHAESKWNEAEHELFRGTRLKAGALLRNIDHPLSMTGIEQAVELAAKVKDAHENLSSSLAALLSGASARDGATLDLDQEDAELTRGFLDVSAIWVSPFCRALQTALVALQHHPVALRDGFVLRSELRERKTVIGRDTLATCQGDKIAENAHARLDKVINGAGQQGARFVDMSSRIKTIKVDPGTTSHEWWNESAESGRAVDARIQEVLVQLKLSSQDKFLLVTHSLLIQHLMARYMSQRCREDHAELVQRLSTQKVPNCGVVAIRMDTTSEVHTSIDKVRLMFGTTIDEFGSVAFVPDASLRAVPEDKEMMIESGSRAVS